MGASISIRVSGDKKRAKMLAFMAKNYRRWSEVFPEGRKSESAGDPSGDFARRRKDIGFEYAAHLYGWERIFVYSVLRWMALKVGDKKARFSKDEITPNVFKKPMPYMTYDGYAHWPIIVCASEKAALKLPDTQVWCAMDKYGLYISGHTSESLVNCACEELMFDPKYDKKFSAAFLKNGGPPQGPARTDKSFAAWRKKHLAIKARLSKPVIARVLPKMRDELKRLDKLWDSNG